MDDNQNNGMNFTDDNGATPNQQPFQPATPTPQPFQPATPQYPPQYMPPRPQQTFNAQPQAKKIAGLGFGITGLTLGIFALLLSLYLYPNIRDIILYPDFYDGFNGIDIAVVRELVLPVMSCVLGLVFSILSLSRKYKGMSTAGFALSLLALIVAIASVALALIIPIPAVV